MSDVTVVCCYNNEKVYSDFVDNLKSQTVPCEIIGIDNRGNKGFTSCAAAYNSVIHDIKTKYVVYSHQDILFTESDCLEKFVKCLEQTGTNDIAGVAGIKFSDCRLYTDIKQIFKSTGKLDYAGGHRVEGGMMECDTLDECFFGGHSEYFRENPFDEATCNSWHLYAVEQCLRTKSNYVKRGGGLIVYTCAVSASCISQTEHHHRANPIS